MISIVISIYKSESFLDKAITSILNQNFTDFELILVNDGSPDNSETICLKYANEDKRVKYIKQSNQGAAHAMQAGLLASIGDYIMFLDGDDWIELDTLYKVWNIVEEFKIDIVFWNSFKEFEDRTIESRRPFLKSKLFKDDELGCLKRRAFGLIDCELKNITDFDLLSSGWGKLYKRNILFLDPYILVDRKNIGNFDTELVCRSFFLANCIFFLNEPLNHYRMENSNSITKNHGNELYFKHKVLFESLLNFIYENNLGKDYIQAVNNRITVSILNNLLSITSKNNKNSFVTKYHALNRILSDDLYKQSIANLEFSALKPFHRYFFYLCKFRLTIAVFGAGYFLRLLR